MSGNNSISSNDLVVDEQAVAAFAQEIVDAVHNSALACIYDQADQTIWHQTYQSGAPDKEDCLPAKDQTRNEPTKRSLGNGNFAFDFPLECANVEGCIFTLVIYTLDPPSLMSVSYQISQMVDCIARQIDLDATLGTAVIHNKQVPSAPRQTKVPQETSPEPTPDTSLAAIVERIVGSCFDECDADCVAAILPAAQIVAYAGTDAGMQASVQDLAMRLYESVERKRRVVSAKITMANGVSRRVVCAPILRKQRAIDGVALLVCQDIEPSHSKIVRVMANKIAQMRQSQPLQSKLLNRLEVVAKMSHALGTQGTMPHSLIYFDADKTHTINDAFGYSGGDRALDMFRQILVDSAGANDSVAQLGGDRFAMFLPGASGDTALAKATQVLQFLNQESIGDDSKSINLSASAGVVDTLAATKGAEDMLVLSEVASRGAQERGGNQCALFQDIDSSIIQRRSDVDKVGFLQMALIENRFVLHAQKIEAINADSGQKFELLARLDAESGADASPAQFLSAAERYQLMGALDRWVINSALTSISASDNTLETSLAIFCINVSAQSLQDDSFVEFIEARIAESGVPPDSLCFELTETSLVRHIDRAQRFVSRLQRLGCLVALDDFGTGYSSFAYLKTLPVNFLKIDGSFVRDILESDLSKAIVHAVVNIAEVIGAQTVAEHVENPMVQAWLKQAGVHFVQGFVVHKPEPLSAVLDGMDGLSGIFANDSQSIDLREPLANAPGETLVLHKLA